VFAKPTKTPEDGDMTENDASPASDGRRRRLLIGTTGAAVVLIGGAAFAATQMGSSDSESLREPAVPVVTTASPTSAGPSDAASASAAAVTPSVSASASASATTAPATAEKEPQSGENSRKEADEKIREAREQMEDHGVEVQRALGDPKTKPVKIDRRTETLGKSTVQIETAQADLSGQGLRLIAAGKGEPAGNGVSCTNSIRFAAGAEPTARPNVLLCWRTSDSRSVVTMTVTPEGKPSKTDSAEIISKEWSKLS
jgi:hypothetical protein